LFEVLTLLLTFAEFVIIAKIREFERQAWFDCHSVVEQLTSTKHGLLFKVCLGASDTIVIGKLPAYSVL
jgi:hypothetical protein